MFFAFKHDYCSWCYQITKKAIAPIKNSNAWTYAQNVIHLFAYALVFILTENLKGESEIVLSVAAGVQRRPIS